MLQFQMSQHCWLNYIRRNSGATDRGLSAAWEITMPFCQACGSAVTPDSHFCPVCGKPVNIGFPVNPSDAFTGAPGAAASSATISPALSLPGQSSSAAPNVNPYAVPAAPAPGTHAGATTVRAKRPVGVILISLLTFTWGVGAICMGLWLASFVGGYETFGESGPGRLLVSVFPVFGEGLNEISTEGNPAIAAYLGIAAFCAVLTYGLWKLHKWGLIHMIVTASFMLLRAVAIIYNGSGTLFVQLFLIAMEIWILSYLLKPRVRSAFGVAQGQ